MIRPRVSGLFLFLKGGLISKRNAIEKNDLNVNPITNH